jgi:hypothetical protein
MHSPLPQTLWIYLGLVALIVVRFLMRELRVRRMSLARIFYAPAFVGLIAVWLAYLTLSTAPYLAVTLAIAVVAAIVAGVPIGWAVAHFTTVQNGGNGTAIVRGSWITVAIWLGALALRWVGRLAVGTSSLPEQLMLNTALIVLVGVSITVVRYRIRLAALAAPPLPVPAA